ncbi:Uncharacterised protein [uncultured archaeon]|nr:Uncharacterised protein [uncultured archaeon]
MYNWEIKPFLQKILDKLLKKDKPLYEQILGKINEIINCGNVEHYKNLKHDLKEFKRVHIGHFVLIFKYNQENNIISFEDFEHHDKVYLKKY